MFSYFFDGIGEPGGLLSMGSHRVGHDWSDLATVAVGMELLDHMVNEVQLYKKVELFSETEPTVLLSLSSVQSLSPVRLFVTT